jgi:hypothetical protein
MSNFAHRHSAFCKDSLDMFQSPLEYSSESESDYPRSRGEKHQKQRWEPHSSPEPYRHSRDRSLSPSYSRRHSDHHLSNNSKAKRQQQQQQHRRQSDYPYPRDSFQGSSGKKRGNGSSYKKDYAEDQDSRPSKKLKTDSPSLKKKQPNTSKNTKPPSSKHSSHKSSPPSSSYKKTNTRPSSHSRHSYGQVQHSTSPLSSAKNKGKGKHHRF